MYVHGSRSPHWQAVISAFVVGAVVAFALTTAFFTSRLPRVGGDQVPYGTVCQEDELIGVSPWGVRCWHLDEIIEAG